MKNKIKILIFGMSSTLGGIETYLYNLAMNCDYNLYSLEFVSFSDKSIVHEEELKQKGCNIIQITPRSANVKKYTSELKELFKNNKYDYVYFNLITLSGFEPICIANKYSDAKIIIHSHTAGSQGRSDLNIKTKLLHFVGKVKTRNVESMKLACSENAGRYMFGSSEYTVLNNGIDVEKFAFNQECRKEIRDEFNIKDDELLIGLIARLEAVKNPLFLIDVFYEIKKINSKAKLLIVGDGSLKNEVEQKAKKYDIQESVMLPGVRNDAYKFYSAFDTFVMTSLYEGFSISLLEAQTNGLRCFVSDNVDKKSDVTGNVVFCSLNDTPLKWAETILNGAQRVKDNGFKISDEYNSKDTYKKLFEFLKK